MAFASLSHRINSLPLILCEPILRRVEENSVTVWVALKEEKKVWLEVYEDLSIWPSAPNLKKLLAGEHKTISLGEHFHILAVTTQHADALRWDYQVTRTNYEIKFLDGRTRRGYPKPTTADRGKQAHGDIISETSMRQQFDHDDVSLPPKEVTMVVVPTSLISIPGIELEEFPMFAHAYVASTFKKGVYRYDFFDHWKNQSKAAEKFLKLLSERNAQAPATTGDKRLSRLVVLTGDVHLAGASRVEYENDDHNTIYAQVISSSFKKQDYKTRLLHQYSYDFTWLMAFPYAGYFFFATCTRELKPAMNTTLREF